MRLINGRTSQDSECPCAGRRGGAKQFLTGGWTCDSKNERAEVFNLTVRGRAPKYQAIFARPDCGPLRKKRRVWIAISRGRGRCRNNALALWSFVTSEFALSCTKNGCGTAPRRRWVTRERRSPQSTHPRSLRHCRKT